MTRAPDPEPTDAARRRLPWLAPVLCVVACAWAAWFFVHQDQTWATAGLDGRVYRDAARGLLDGVDVYSTRFDGLPFTYPPFALVVFVPLALVPASVAAVLMFALSVGALLAIVRWCQEYAASGRAGSWWVTVALVGALSVCFEPARTTLGLGQVNLILLALIMGLDMRSGRWTGAGAGLATAVKVTPGLLVVAQAVRGDLRAFARGVLAFTVATGIGVVVAPAASRTYFSSLLWDSGRPGGLDYLQNQSLRAVFARHLPAHAPLAWAVASAVVLAVGAVAVRRHRDDVFLALTAAAVTGLLVSPVSWSHHWVWVLPCVAVGVRRGWRSPVGLASLLLLAMTFVEVLYWPPGNPPLLTEDLYVVAGCVWLAVTTLAPGSPVGGTEPAQPKPIATSSH